MNGGATSRARLCQDLGASYRFHVPLLARDHVFGKLISLHLWDLQPIPQLLDLSAVGAAQSLILSLTLLQLFKETGLVSK